MLQTFVSPSSHPNVPERQLSAPPLTSLTEDVVDVPNQSEEGMETSLALSQSSPHPAQSSPLQPAATINLTLDDVMRLLHMTADQYDGRTLAYRPQPLYPHMPRGHGGTMPRMHYPTHAPLPVGDQRPPTTSPMKRGKCRAAHALKSS